MPDTLSNPAFLPLSSEQRLIGDLERLLRYATTAKSVDAPKEVIEEGTKALLAAKLGGETAPLSQEAQLAVISAVDSLSARVYPATTASLEIAEVMEVGSTVKYERHNQIRVRVTGLISRWIWSAFIALFLVFLTTGVEKLDPTDLTPNLDFTIAFSRFFNPVILGFLGACAFILRSILQSLGNYTFVLRDGTTYTLRSILGIILGFLIPRLLDLKALGPVGDFAVPFLAGYAVEPMFAALDNLVLTIRDAVSRGPVPIGDKQKAG